LSYVEEGGSKIIKIREQEDLVKWIEPVCINLQKMKKWFEWLDEVLWLLHDETDCIWEELKEDGLGTKLIVDDPEKGKLYFGYSKWEKSVNDDYLLKRREASMWEWAW